VVQNILQPIVGALTNERTNTEKFRKQLSTLFNADRNGLLDRLSKGSEYYHNLLTEKLTTILIHQEEVRAQKRSKTYFNQLADLDVALTRKIEEVDKVQTLTNSILNGIEEISLYDLSARHKAERVAILEGIKKNAPVKETGKGKKRKKDKGDDRSTYEISIDMLKSGKTIDEIAKERNLVRSTIEGHLAKAVQSGVLGIEAFLDEATISEVNSAMDSSEEVSLSALYHSFGKKYSYGVLRAMIAHRSINPKTAPVND